MEEEGRHARRLDLKTVLHAGCGTGKIHELFEHYEEIRLDCDPAVKPDIVSSIVAMPDCLTDSYDGVYCSHVLEHLYAHEVPMALREFQRVLKPGGLLFLMTPDLQRAGQWLQQDNLDAILFQTTAGPITPVDLIYGHSPSVAAGNLHMAHHTGFTRASLMDRVSRAGFVNVRSTRDEMFNLWAFAEKANAPV